ncbi:MAG: hypothetical protein WC470_03360 [Candidatus Paceibacterota bacterium]
MNFEKPRELEQPLEAKENSNESEDDSLELFIDNKELYHGSGTKGIKELRGSGNTTIGNGIYLTSKEEDALCYAKSRYNEESKNKEPTIYQVSIENIKLLDLRKIENIKKILLGFRPILEQELKKPNLKWIVIDSIEESIKAIDSTIESGRLKDVTFNTQDYFTNYIKSLGYDGLVALEGGEENHTHDHDTYLIFDPQKVKIEKEENL